MTSQAKLDAAERELNTSLKKVFAAVPLQEAWTTPQILDELARQGHKQSISHVTGCLNSLKALKLVREPAPREWVRYVASTTTGRFISLAPQPEEPMAEPEPITKKSTPVDRLAEIANRARATAKQLNALAKDLDDTALQIAEEAEASKESTEKLKQLKGLLREIGG